MFSSSQSLPSASRRSATCGRRRHRDDELHLEQRRVGVGRRTQRRVDALDVDPQTAQQMRDRLHQSGVIHGPGVEANGQRRRPLRHVGVRRTQLRAHVAVAAQRAEAVMEPADRLPAAGDQHHHRELAVQVDHAAVLQIAPPLDDVARHLVDQAGAVVADGREHGVVQDVHGADRTGNAGATAAQAASHGQAHASRSRPARERYSETVTDRFRADLHVHSRYSDASGNAGIRVLRGAESFTDPVELYHARAPGAWTSSPSPITTPSPARWPSPTCPAPSSAPSSTAGSPRTACACMWWRWASTSRRSPRRTRRARTFTTSSRACAGRAWSTTSRTRCST